MYTIGEFSRINRITPKTLRYYDKIGLLKPFKIDSWTGYRHYSAEQLTQIKKILLFKSMGFNLEEVKSIIDGDSQTNSSLENRIKDIELEISKSNIKLKLVKDYLENLNKGVTMKNPEIKSLPEVIVASMRTTIPTYDKYFDIVPKMGEYMNSVGAECLVPAYCFTIYHDGEYKESDIDVEICEAVTSFCKESEKVKFKIVEGVNKAACMVHKGSYETIGETYRELFNWIDSSGFQVIDNPRESYIDGIWNKDDPKLWTTEIQVPIK